MDWAFQECFKVILPMGHSSQGKRKKKCAKVWYVTVKIIDS
jgi:hypothetical protein